MIQDHIYFSNAFFELSVDIQDKILNDYRPNLQPELLEQIKSIIMVSRFEKYVGDSVEKHRIKKPKTVKKPIKKKTTPIVDTQ